MSNSFAALMALSHMQTQEQQRNVESALADRQRKEELRRKQQAERERKERELERKMREKHFEDEKKEKERREKREQERLAKEREKERREEEHRQALLHGPKKASRYPVSKSSVRDDVRKSRLPDDDDDDSGSGGAALTRQEKRERKLQLDLRRSYSRPKRSTTSTYHKAGRRLPGGAIDITTTPSSAGMLPPADNPSMSVRDRIAATPATLTALNTKKRDTRTIDEIVRDKAKARAGKVLDGEKARDFHDWFTPKGSKATDSKSLSPSARPSAPNSGPATPPGPITKDGASSNAATAAAAPRRSSSTAVPSSKTSAKPVPAGLQTKRADRTEIRTLPPKSIARPRGTASVKGGPTKSHVSSHSLDSSKKRPRSPSPSDSLPPPRRRRASNAGNDSNISDQIWRIFGKDRGAYVQRNVYSDDEDMEADASALEREEKRRSFFYIWFIFFTLTARRTAPDLHERKMRRRKPKNEEERKRSADEKRSAGGRAITNRFMRAEPFFCMLT
ncbi:hypothetical protein EWM64_g1881 [Hericium alpestre]|uniref:Uncharacterized protein n=1 Tax=Hericium alpestre TaxID=135208 RepID=A0A4Z0A713_9AGAM|nr:hypothetical protein EWM64_g1881 [Hericium alpestre]